MSFKLSRWSSGVLLVIFALLDSGRTVQAQGSRSKTGSTEKAVINVMVEGKLYSKIEGSESKGGGADRYALRVTRAVSDAGEELNDLAGVTLRFSKNDRSRELLSKHTEGDRLVIRGRLHVEKELIEVESFKKASSAPKGSESK